MKNNQPTKRHKVYTIIFSLWSATILFLTSYPKLHIPIADKLWNSDKLAHFAVYTIFAWLFIKMNHHKTTKNNLRYLIIMLCSIPILDELHQWPIPGRSFSFYDILADSLGFLLIIFLYSRKKI